MIFEILSELFVGLILVLAGGGVSYYLIHKYQKDKDVRETRERLLNLLSEVARKFMTIHIYWNKWVLAFDPKLSNAESQQQKTKARDILQDTVLEFQNTLKMLIGRLVVYFQYTESELDFFTKLEKQGITTINIINESLRSGKPIKGTKEKLAKERKVMDDYLGKLLHQIIIAKSM